MKKLLFFIALSALSCASFGQKALKDVKHVDFYGIDFSKATAVGVVDEPTKLKNALNDINFLFVSEPKKFDVPKFFSKEVEVSIEMVNEINRTVDSEKLVGSTAEKKLSDETIKAMVKNYKVQGEGVGLVFIATELNKGKNSGTYHVVFFNKGNKEILYSDVVSGEARGFGLRNYWAGSVFNIMKDWKPAKR